ncbi:MAG: hypothetical protein ABI809_01690 [Caldimonas sp.]
MATRLLFKSPDGDIVRVGVGFSWQAFFVGSLRTMLKFTWPLFCALPVAYLVFARKGNEVPTSTRVIALLLIFVVAYLGFMLFCGLYGNRWLVASLLRRGYRQVGKDGG